MSLAKPQQLSSRTRSTARRPLSAPLRLCAGVTLSLLAAACTVETGDSDEDDYPVLPAAGDDVGGTGGTGAAGNTGGTGNAGAGDTGTCPSTTADCDGDGTCETDLSSNEHCGACGNACTPSGECSYGGCVEPLSSSYVCAMAKDESATYFLLRDPNDHHTVQRLPNGGGPLQEVASASIDWCYRTSMAVDGEEIYVANVESGNVVVRAMPKSGGFFSILDSYAPASTHDTSVGSDGVFVYWTGDDGIYRAPIGYGSGQLWVKTYCAYHMVVSAGTVYWSCPSQTQGFPTGSFGRRSTSDGPELDFNFEKLGPADSPAVFTVDSSGLYWESWGSLRSLSLSGGAETVLATGDFGSTSGIDVDASRVFFSGYSTEIHESRVFQVPKSGGSAVIVGDPGTDEVHGDHVASDGSNVYAGSDGLFQLAAR
ncbi:MAG: hypothetical protein JRI23_33060 [Deltaproteobacteria bacterium]|jgi:hypothetical protein|nr:hypothetical protein [Deltaproteobacteria bacterium]MBW2537084.1 hypothetical protein [Deltaproteobacteria bacterium]